MRKQKSLYTVGIISVALFLFAAYITSIFFIKYTPLSNPIGGGPPANISITLTPTSAHAKYAALIHYRVSGFDPSVVTIKQGQTVEWVNDESDQGMWIASAPHPQHTDYPGFDQLHGVGSGQTYTFIFAKPGVFSYHNHLNPNITGKVIVL